MYTSEMEQDTLYKLYPFLGELKMVVIVVLVVQAVSDSWIQ
jgi:hypothetical protein